MAKSKKAESAPKAIAFYRKLGLVFPEGAENEGHAEAQLAGGLRFLLDTEQVVDWTRRLVEQFVVRVEDYNLLAPNGQAMPIATPAEFLEFGEDALVDDVGAEIMRTVWMSDEQKKSSAKPSVSSPAETAPSSGTAVPAGATASPLPGGATTHEPRPASSM